MALITTQVLRARCRDTLLSVSVRRVLVVISTLLDLRAEESRIPRHVKSRRFPSAAGVNYPADANRVSNPESV